MYRGNGLPSNSGEKLPQLPFNSGYSIDSNRLGIDFAIAMIFSKFKFKWLKSGLFYIFMSHVIIFNSYIIHK